ncbi:MAG: cyclic nucleotide-binding domain-containing protein [Gammaproteobacteria bacterium]|nr:cyclic nucleotide-binding domain-containing protein [Gammaproteobacteria bacterium]
MFTDDQIPEQCTQLWNNCSDLVSKLVDGAPIKNAGLRIPAETEIDINKIQSIYLIREGILREKHENNILANYEQGDIVGLDAIFNHKPTQLMTDFAIVVDEYDATELLNHIRSDETRSQTMIQFMSGMYHSYQLISSHYKQDDADFHPEIRHYDEDETIIEEGGTDNEVYTLLSGSADVLVSNTQVGEIKRDEIFGAIAALTGTPRTAKVVASSECSVLVVASDRFQDLLEKRPDTVTKLIEDMARTIVASNQKIVDLSSK